MQDLESILAKFTKIVSTDFCENLARKTGFVKRSTSQLKGCEFAQAMMIPNSFLETETLNSLAVRMNKINKLCNLTASALAQRINSPSAAKFMKACLGYVLKDVINKSTFPLSDLPNLAKFNRTLIQDSTKAELHEKLSPHFKGSGGAASKSAVKIDYIFDYQSEESINVEFFSGNIPDQSLANRIIPLLQKNDLVLRDLGYYLLESMKKIEEEKAYYLSRFKVDVNVYVYRARWRIEIIFKQWKSCLKLHIFKGFNKDRFHCFMYGRLIMAILMGCLGPPLMRYAFELGFELSCYKLINYLLADHMLFRAIQEGTLNELIKRLVEDVPRRLCMDKRKRNSLRENIRKGTIYYNVLETNELEINVA